MSCGTSYDNPLRATCGVVQGEVRSHDPGRTKGTRNTSLVLEYILIPVRPSRSGIYKAKQTSAHASNARTLAKLIHIHAGQEAIGAQRGCDACSIALSRSETAEQEQGENDSDDNRVGANTTKHVVAM